MPSRFGVLIGQRYPWQLLVEHAHLVESTGFHSLWVADQFTNPFEETDWLDAWTTLAALATATERIRLGTLVTSIVYRHPAVIAKQAVTVDHISHGRLDLGIGIGAGGVPADHHMTGTPMWSAGERQDRLREFVELVDQLLRERRSSYAGRYYSGTDVFMQPAPVQQPRPPLVIAAHGPRSLRLAAERADTWSLYEPGAGLTGADATDAVRRMNRYIDEKAEAVGRDPRSITRSLCCGYAASSAWRTVDEAMAGVAQFEKAGINEFIFSYTPDAAPMESTSPVLEVELGVVEIPALLPDASTLRELAAALRLTGHVSV